MRSRDRDANRLLSYAEVAELRARTAALEAAKHKVQQAAPEPAPRPLKDSELLPVRIAVLREGKKLSEVAKAFSTDDETIARACSDTTRFRGAWPPEIASAAPLAVVKARHR